MWIACSPGGRFFRFSAIFTPECLFGLIFAVPTLSPFASCNRTVTVLVCASKIAHPKARASTVTATWIVFMAGDYSPVFEPEVSLKLPVLDHHFLDDSL